MEFIAALLIVCSGKSPQKLHFCFNCCLISDLTLKKDIDVHLLNHTLLAQKTPNQKSIQKTMGSYTFLMLTYPIQAAQILHQVFICRGIIVKYSMLLVHTS